MKELISCIKNLPKHFKTSLVNLWRNGVMTFSSIFAVTITLLLIGVISVLALNVQDISANIEEGVRIYVKLERSIDENAENEVGKQIKQLKGVASATYFSKDEELSKLIDKQGEDGKELFESYRDDNPLGAAYEVEAKDPTKLASLAKKIKDIPNVNSVNYGGDSTQSMVSTLNTIQTGGTVFIVGLVVVALFMISNTIKITITARSTEISIMRMVGASNWYIRIPFMLEGMLIGLFGAIIPILVLVYGYGALYNYTGGSLMSSMLVLKAPMPFIRDFSFILAGLGAGVGLIGSFVSIRRFLKF
ncbi:permease-like cell division protein FtsX [Faecalibacillus faecis]|uniref:permease-like cell division protein FtsX n=1 Tax=Faecalibacillus faecis TaxID=1982628 RepID=UPI00066488C9|nr:permease-like cell division protein FtsX [Faecalibacillus faecis]KMV78751.1 cell division ABC transporter, permease protein FtsX [Coprobacillus sp. 8_1_38FAA]RGT62469.1 ABC transporter permease [Coprobacillus sp. AF18-40]RGT86250.1 ABC transporter permease [Coprobacillus sp. AF18-15LB]RHB07796.1 ABC transporter permease [Coprobacillus sp. AM42-12AC]RHH05788.1 ABC transporter permease [Coprobacillus sp. AM18-4LB-d2]